MVLRYYFSFFSILFFLASCDSLSFKSDSWEIYLEQLGSSSSPKAADLNGDGILDIVIGAGGKEFTNTQHGVIAINGANGEVLWSVPTINQMVGTPIFRDLTADETPDVIIGGRSAQLMLINGLTGQKIWEYHTYQQTDDLINDTLLLNFFNPQFCPDLDGDGQEDLVVPFGGFIKAKPEEKNRPTGYLLAISSRTGGEILRMPAPDGKEVYLSPIIANLGPSQELYIIYGTGGETIGGGLYALKLKDFENRKFENFIVLAQDSIKGFIAPPIMADMNGDRSYDIVVNAVNGTIICIDGVTFEQIWATNIGQGFEGYAMPSVGNYYGDDAYPDVFSVFGYGPWPETKYTSNFLLDGQTGRILSSDSVGTFQYASPISYDLNHDGTDEVILAINNTIMTKLPNTKIESRLLGNELIIYDFKKNVQQKIRPTKIGSNLGSTPLLSDIDNDGYLDIISCYMSDSKNFYSFNNMVIERIELKIKKKQEFIWTSYMGYKSDGIRSRFSN